MSDNTVGHINVAFGWIWMNLGFISGLLLGLKVEQFGLSTRDGQTWKDGYCSIPRRLMRLGHVAFIALPLLNIVYGQFIDGANLPLFWKRTGSDAMIIGAVFLPILVMTAAFYRPVKILLGIPAAVVLLGTSILAWGLAK